MIDFRKFLKSEKLKFLFGGLINASALCPLYLVDLFLKYRT